MIFFYFCLWFTESWLFYKNYIFATAIFAWDKTIITKCNEYNIIHVMGELQIMKRLLFYYSFFFYSLSERLIQRILIHTNTHGFYTEHIICTRLPIMYTNTHYSQLRRVWESVKRLSLYQFARAVRDKCIWYIIYIHIIHTYVRKVRVYSSCVRIYCVCVYWCTHARARSYIHTRARA